MTTTGMTFLDLDWLNKSADGAVCTRCGYVHTFLADAHQWLAPEAANPERLPRDPLATGPRINTEHGEGEPRRTSPAEGRQ